MLPASDMDHSFSFRLENKESNLFRHDGLPFLHLAAFHPYRRPVGKKESGPVIMIFYLLGQGGKRKAEQGAEIFLGNGFRKMGKPLFRKLGKINILNPTSRFFRIDPGSLPFIGFFEQHKDPLDGAMGKKVPPGNSLFPVNSPEIFPQGRSEIRCFSDAEEPRVRADFNGDDRRLLSTEKPQQLSSPLRIAVNGADQQQGREFLPFLPIRKLTFPGSLW